jgi:hypothetical protein
MKLRKTLIRKRVINRSKPWILVKEILELKELYFVEQKIAVRLVLRRWTRHTCEAKKRAF